MRAFAILDGGGVKGAALAGALKASQDRGIEFAGYGGTSAGSIVALLACAGYTGAELQAKFVDELDFASLLDDGDGKRLIAAKDRLSKVTAAIQANLAMKLFKTLPAYLRTRRLVKDVWRPLGLYSGDKLEEWLDMALRAKLPELSDKEEITFEDLAAASKPLLRVVASNITLRKAVVYSREMNGGSVIEAVRASAGYPFVFQPVVNEWGERLVDGGLASNLPAFLFAEEHRRWRLPVLAFDLVATPHAPNPYDGTDFCRELLDTAIEAGDELLRVVLKGIEHIQIETPAAIDTLDFNLNKGQREQLFQAGYSQAAEWLAQWKPLQLAARSAGSVRNELTLSYGEPDIYQPLLWAAAKDIEDRSKAKDVWTAILLPTGRNTFVIVYQHGIVDADTEAYRSLEFDGEIPWLKQAWETGKPAFADYEPIRANPSSASRHVIATIPARRLCCLCCPIPATEKLPVGLLLIDTSTSAAETGWLEGATPPVNALITERLAVWSILIDRVIP
ncbi:MAG TPA: patatin-like phospholipase family protein [Chthoniobacter sp.]|nr:patatin-like phospholipase family protein [Chthoniobacter sp.]